MERLEKRTRPLLLCGVLSPAVYVATDIVASTQYPGYSFRGQAVSELFAIGAPTADLVVTAFSFSSVALLAFAVGVWRAADDRRLMRALAGMFAGSAVVGLLIWNVFPMHMRGEARSFTDTMHLILASNPFVLLSLVLAMLVFRGAFRICTVAALLIMVVPAVGAFSYVRALEVNQPTPWLGATERLAQYGYAVWQVILALVLFKKDRAGLS
jgi:hypothetical protein